MNTVAGALPAPVWSCPDARVCMRALSPPGRGDTCVSAKDPCTVCFAAAIKDRSALQRMHASLN
ncbi:MAG: hypothetical protein CVV31_13025 [Methanomicrobiales archaeon HGW-Methanomicrobiales-2]|jgi:hypothetical protein|nr:MAG: hypothetical protein CVV31_13025 [Methanomicrobiales archaeon HGW-Methanomicrobiales-2]